MVSNPTSSGRFKNLLSRFVQTTAAPSWLISLGGRMQYDFSTLYVLLHNNLVNDQMVSSSFLIEHFVNLGDYFKAKTSWAYRFYYQFCSFIRWLQELSEHTTIDFNPNGGPATNWKSSMKISILWSGSLIKCRKQYPSRRCRSLE